VHGIKAGRRAAGGADDALEGEAGVVEWPGP
jgi:hypothetical protein